jgi:hypothetical protein
MSMRQGSLSNAIIPICFRRLAAAEHAAMLPVHYFQPFSRLLPSVHATVLPVYHFHPSSLPLAWYC